jgi:NADH:ubiquinone oxidoreductase subunit C
MTNQELQTLINSWIPELEFTVEESEFLNVHVPSDKLRDLMLQLRDHEKTAFNYLFCLSGVDWGEELGIVYHLESTVHRHIIVVKVKTSDREAPNFDTVCDIWRTAEFHEREVFDFFGITFNNHPNMTHLFLNEDWQGFPMRKDFEDPINMIIR